jgi:curved DNA-binding protein CbpA
MRDIPLIINGEVLRGARADEMRAKLQSQYRTDSDVRRHAAGQSDAVPAPDDDDDADDGHVQVEHWFKTLIRTRSVR